jgi:hypothetical protein
MSTSGESARVFNGLTTGLAGIRTLNGAFSPKTLFFNLPRDLKGLHRESRGLDEVDF